MTTGQTLALLKRYESRNVTFIAPDGSWPIVWKRAKGVHVWDAEGKRYLDLTAAFGVAAAGHANPRVVRAGRRQMGTLLHAMGDVHPHPLKAQLARELSRITFERWRVGNVTARADARPPESRTNGKTIFCNSGFEAVEAALKTVVLATGRPGVIAFEGAYHGVGYGALNATHRDHFRAPFRSQLVEFGHFVPFPPNYAAADRSWPISRKSRRLASQGGKGTEELERLETQIRDLFRIHKIGAILVEPIQGRGGINVPPRDFLPLLRRLADEHEALLIVDEIYTGFGRTGKWFACEHSRTVPDIICLGKALTGGFPLSACVGRANLMDAWPESSGEAIHTSTFLGHPVGCAMALAQIDEIRRRKLVQRSARLGGILLESLSRISGSSGILASARGLGLMAGLELRCRDGAPASAAAARVIEAMLHRAYILLPEGKDNNVLSFTPPLIITEKQLRETVEQLGAVL